MSSNKALLRIQMANVYRFILENGIFDGSESDNENILNAVEDELYSFATSRLEILMGMKNIEDSNIVIGATPLPFDGDEINALKQLAQTVLNRQPSQQLAQPNQNEIPQPIQQSTRRRRSRATHSAQQPIAQPAQQPIQPNQGIVQQPNATTAMSGVQKTANRPLYAQNASPVTRPQPMPSQSEIDAKNAREVDQAAKNFSVDGGAAAKLLGNFIQSQAPMGQAEE